MIREMKSNTYDRLTYTHKHHTRHYYIDTNNNLIKTRHTMSVLHRIIHTYASITYLFEYFNPMSLCRKIPAINWSYKVNCGWVGKLRSGVIRRSKV